MNVAAYIQIRVASGLISSRSTPYELLFGQKPNLSHLRAFGCRCWFTNCTSCESKLEKRATEEIFIGHTRGFWGYKLWDTARNAVFVSRNAQFDEGNTNTYQPSEQDNDYSSGKVYIENMFENSEKSVQDEQASSSKESNTQNQQETKTEYQFIDDVLEEPVLPRRSSRQRQPTTSWWRRNQALISTLSSEPKTFSKAIRSPDFEH